MNITINLQQRVLLGASIALSVFIVSTFSFGLWQWHNDWVLAHQEMATKAPIIAKDETSLMIAAIPDAHLFGKAFSKTGVPITNLQLRVTGIVKAATEKSGIASKAYISISGQPSKIYQIGDNLPYGVKIYDITSTSIILENNGHLEKLLLPREKLQFKSKWEFGEHAVS